MPNTSLIRLSKEIESIDSALKELVAAEQAVRRTEKLRLKLASTGGFYQELGVKMDTATQRQMGKLDEISTELDEIVRNIQCMSAETPTSHTFEEDSQIVISFCSDLTAFLRSDRSGNCPKLTLPVEKAVQRLENTPVNS